MITICKVCNQDHAKPLKFWCDRSSLEIKNDDLLETCRKLQAENKLLREQHERDSDAMSSIVNILISEGFQYKHKARLERIFERQANQGER